MPRLNAAQCTRQFGVTPSIIHHVACNNFSISPFYRDCFDTYNLRYWQADYFLSKVKDGLLCDWSGECFLVVYHGTTRGKVLAAGRSQVALSFRAPREEFGLVPYVLVSLTENK